MMRLVLLFLFLLIGACVAHGLAVHFEIESRDENALFARYPGQHVSIIDSVEWPSYETCFEIEVSQPRPGRATRQIVMISSFGHDQDNWGFSGEFKNMRECVAAFDRG
jgi:hypothetical protein